jgi:hypothetical protein
LTALVQARLLLVGEAAEDGLPVVGRALELERTLEVVPAVEVEADGIGVEVRAVVELDAGAQFKGPRGAVGVRLPRLGEPRDDFGAALL